MNLAGAPRRDTETVTTSVAGAVNFLIGNLTKTPRASIAFLTSTQQSLNLLNLYRQFFPQEWATSNKRAFIPEKQNPNYTEREVEFLRLFNERVAPIYLDWILECDDPEEGKAEWIPLCHADDWDYYHDEELNNLKEPYQLALALTRLEEGEGATLDWIIAQQGINLSDGCREIITRTDVNYAILDAVFDAGTSPLKHLGRAIRVVTYSSDNVLLDYHPEYECLDAPWSVENIEWLIECRREMEETNASIDDLTNWLKAADAEFDGEVRSHRVEAAIKLWMLADRVSRYVPPRDKLKAASTIENWQRIARGYAGLIHREIERGEYDRAIVSQLELF